VAVVIEEKFGIEKAMMTTVHSYTASQALQDAPSKDVREGRNAAENIVPTTTGAATAAAKAFPKLKGKFDGLSIRVPTPVVSLSDFTFVTSRDVTKEEVNEALIAATKEARFQGILDVTDEPLVSSDFIGNPHSGIVDLALTNVVGGNLLKVVAGTTTSGLFQPLSGAGGQRWQDDRIAPYYHYENLSRSRSRRL